MHFETTIRSFLDDISNSRFLLIFIQVRYFIFSNRKYSEILEHFIKILKIFREKKNNNKLEKNNIVYNI